MRKWWHIPSCTECGEVRVIHPIEKLISYFEEREGSEPRSIIPQRQDPIQVERSLYFAKNFLTILPWFKLETTTDAIRDSRCLALFEGAESADVSLYLLTYFGKPYRYFACKKDKPNTFVTFTVLPSQLLPITPAVFADDKFRLCSFLRDNHIETGNVLSVKDETSLIAVTQSLQFPLITKPQIGTRGRHTILHISNQEELVTAFRISKQISTRVVVQEELVGTVFRFTMVNHKFLGCAKREYPYVVGDGIHTIPELIARENEHPLRNTSVFRHIPFSAYHQDLLEKKGYTNEYILPEGEKCIVGDKNSRLNGTITEDVTETVHQSIIDEMERASKLLGFVVMGIDAIFESVSEPLRRNARQGIIECNTLPYIDVHHFPFSGKRVNVAAELWNHVYAELDKLYPLS